MNPIIYFLNVGAAITAGILFIGLAFILIKFLITTTYFGIEKLTKIRMRKTIK